MAVSDTSITSFGTDPKRGLEVVDAYEQGGLNGFLADGKLNLSADSLGPLLNDITPNQLQTLQKDESFINFAKENGGVSKSIGLIKSTFPKSANDVSGIIGDITNGDLIGSYNTALRLKNNMPSSLYNNIQQDVFNKTLSLTSGITDFLSPLGDYFCRLSTSSINGNGFSLDKAIQAALDGAIGAISAFNMCGFDTVDYIDSLDVDDTLRVVIGKTILDDGAKNGVLDSVSNLTVRLDDSLNDSEKSTYASNLASSFVPGRSTLIGEMGIFKDTITDLSPGFADAGSSSRLNLMASMNPATLLELEKDPSFRSDAAMVNMVGNRISEPVTTLSSQYPFLITA